MRTMMNAARAALAAVALLAFTAEGAQGQGGARALVYCPVGIDDAGCTAIVNALAPQYLGGVDKGYDGSGGTINLATADLGVYSVFVVPSLADDGTAAPYATLRDPAIAHRLHDVLLGRIAMWSGSPDIGSASRSQKDGLIRSLASWAGANFATVNGPGLVTLLDQSEDEAARYNWVQGLVGVQITADAAPNVYSSVRTLDAAGSAILENSGVTLAYANMASFGFYLPAGAAGVSLSAVGQTGTSFGGQVVLVTSQGANGGTAKIWTDKNDYAPGETVTFTGTGFQGGESVTITLHEDPAVHADRNILVTADASGNFTDRSFAPEPHHLGVRFIATALGSAGSRAQTTFTDGNSTVSGTVVSSVSGNPAISGATVTCSTSTTNPCNGLFTTTTNASGAYTLPLNYAGSAATVRLTASAPGYTSAFIDVAVSNSTDPTGVNFTLIPSCTAPSVAGHPANQTVTYNANASFTASATGTAPVTVQWQVSTNGGGTWTDVPSATSTTLNLTAPTVAQSGNQYHAVFTNACGTATSDAAALTVNAKSLTITANNASKPYGTTLTFLGTEFTTSGLVGSDAVTSVTLTSAGAAPTATVTAPGPTYAIVASAAVGTGLSNYTIGYVDGVLTVTAVNSTTTVARTAGNNPSVFGESVTFTATVTPASPAPAGSVTFYDGGTCASPGTALGPAVTLSSGQASVTTSALTAVAHTILACYAGDGNYNASSGTLAHTVNKATPTITWANPADITYGTALSGTQLNATASVAGTFAYTPVSGTVLNAGNGQTLHVDFTPTDATNYSTASKDVLINVLRKTLTATIVGDPTKPYDGNTDATLTPANFSLSGLVGSDNFTVTKTTGTYNDKDVLEANSVSTTLAGGDFTPQGSTLATNYDLPTTATGAGHITPRPATWTTNPASKTYGDPDPSPLTTGSGSNFLAADGVTATYARVAGENASPPTYHITATLSPAAALTNYAITNDGAEFTINKRLATWTTNPASKTYGDPDPTPLTTGSGSNFVAGDGVTATYTRVAGENASPPTYHITATLAATPMSALNNYTITNDGAEFTVNKRLATWTTNANSKTYGDPDPSPLTTGSGSNFVAGDGVTATYTRATGENASPPTYHITATLSATPATALNNYTITNNGAEFTITPKTLTAAIVGDPTKPYDGNTNATLTPANFQLTGLVGTESFAVTKTTGTYNNKNVTLANTVSTTLVGGDFSPGAGTLAANYTLPTSASGPGHIGTRPATVTANNQSKIAGAAFTFAGTEFTPSNFVAGEGVSSVTLTSAGQPVSAVAGSYPIIPSAPVAGAGTLLSNYNIGLVNGTFLVGTNAPPVITNITAPVVPNPISTAVTVSATFTDLNAADIAASQPYTMTFDWGDGSTPTVVSGIAAPGTITQTHTYTSAGVNRVTVTVQEKTPVPGGSDTEEFEFVVIYDPNAGFVTGGGWINSPAGAYVAGPSMTGKATFGFVSKYQKGKTAPSGNTEFQFHAAGMNFSSTSYEWLVVSGPIAQYKGEGTINGSGTYGFLLSSTDGQAAGGGGTDKFRIKIWNKATGAVVYDNQMGAEEDAQPTTAIAQGSIVIHSK